MRTILLIALTITTLSMITCDTSFGGCPSVNYELQSFDPERYLGTWYEVARSKSIPFEKGDCISAQYTSREDGKIGVLNTMQVDGVKESASAVATRDKTDQFRLQVQFGDSFIAKLFKGDYRVVDTDYENYAIVYSCSDFIIGKVEYYWVLSRTPVMEEQKLNEHLAYYQNKFQKTKDLFTFASQDKQLCGY